VGPHGIEHILRLSLNTSPRQTGRPVATESSAAGRGPSFSLAGRHVAHVVADVIQYSQEESGSKEVMPP
jgi:hypothetical protein